MARSYAPRKRRALIAPCRAAAASVAAARGMGFAYLALASVPRAARHAAVLLGSRRGALGLLPLTQQLLSRLRRRRRRGRRRGLLHRAPARWRSSRRPTRGARASFTSYPLTRPPRQACAARTVALPRPLPPLPLSASLPAPPAAACLNQPAEFRARQTARHRAKPRPWRAKCPRRHPSLRGDTPRFPGRKRNCSGACRTASFRAPPLSRPPPRCARARAGGGECVLIGIARNGRFSTSLPPRANRVRFDCGACVFDGRSDGAQRLRSKSRFHGARKCSKFNPLFFSASVLISKGLRQG